jgi:hypothetical protein
MPARAALTFGWPSPDGGALHAAEVLANPSILYRSQSTQTIIHSCEMLFRRRAGGFGPLKDFLACALTPELGAREIECRFDAFAYAFLSSAKNMDLLLPVNANAVLPPSEFAGELRRLSANLRRLSVFERTGKRPGDAVMTKRYLATRRILSRASARDERRVLATLFVSGPSTAREISDDLGISQNLAARILGLLGESGCVSARSGNRYAIDHDHRSLAVAYYLVRETLGLCLLNRLEQHIADVLRAA